MCLFVLSNLGWWCYVCWASLDLHRVMEALHRHAVLFTRTRVRKVSAGYKRCRFDGRAGASFDRITFYVWVGDAV